MMIQNQKQNGLRMNETKNILWSCFLWTILFSIVSCRAESSTEEDCTTAIKQWNKKQIKYSDSCQLYFGHGYDDTPVKLIVDGKLILDTILVPNIVQEAKYYEEIKVAHNQEIKVVVDNNCFLISDNEKSFLMKIDYHNNKVLVWNYNEDELNDLYYH